MLYDFDRCTGELRYSKTLKNIPYLLQLAFSPNSKFIYFSCYSNIYQLDISDTLNTPLVIGVMPNFSSLQVGPDSKIYFTSYFTNNIGYINKPDLPGLACDLKIFPISTPNPNPFQSPQFPNYRLGKISDYDCNYEDPVFDPSEAIHFNYGGQEYINSDRYEMIIDESWKEHYYK